MSEVAMEIQCDSYKTPENEDRAKESPSKCCSKETNIYKTA